jgi:hypothetical protein
VPITALHRALTDPGDLALAPVPAGVRDLLEALDAPPRLAAHLRLVHDVARRLTTALAERYPHMVIDIEAVHFGAAVHDIGKVVHPAELSELGRVAGLEQLLVDVLAGAAGRSKWETFMELDDVLGQLAADADRRLAFQAAHPVNG